MNFPIADFLRQLDAIKAGELDQLGRETLILVWAKLGNAQAHISDRLSKIENRKSKTGGAQ